MFLKCGSHHISLADIVHVYSEVKGGSQRATVHMRTGPSVLLSGELEVQELLSGLDDIRIRSERAASILARRERNRRSREGLRPYGDGYALEGD